MATFNAPPLPEIPGAFAPADVPDDRFFVIAGPCVIESAEQCLEIARTVKGICDALGLPYVFKASFDKANRSSAQSFRGPGLVDGLAVLKRVRSEVGVPVLTDIHEPEQARVVAEAVDVLQIPAFLARQTDLLVAAGRTGRVVNIKKGQFMSPQEMSLAAEKVRAAGGGVGHPEEVARAGDGTVRSPTVLLTERGTFFGYNRLVNDFTGLAVMRELGFPVVFDATHSTQQPAGQGHQSGGNPKFTPLLARAAVAAGVQGLFIECHPDPPRAKSDAATVIDLRLMRPLLESCADIARQRPTWRLAGLL